MLKQFLGCMYGAAIGDALGAPVEFLSYQRIRKIHGSEGIMDFKPWEQFPAGFYTDDFQMTLATAKGIIQAAQSNYQKSLIESVYEEYLVWLKTQNIDSENRFPGDTCLRSLQSNTYGTIEQQLNDRKGAGGIMRVSPVGLMYPPQLSFLYGAQSAAITHGHPTGFLSSGFLASFISFILEGKTIEESIEYSVNKLIQYPDHEETLHKVLQAVEYSESNRHEVNAIQKMGEGWIAEEALAISLYAVLKHRQDFTKAVLLAVNHGGDSDTTGSITGALMGTILGVDQIPQKWIDNVEKTDDIRKISEQLYHIKFKKNE